MHLCNVALTIRAPILHCMSVLPPPPFPSPSLRPPHKHPSHTYTLARAHRDHWLQSLPNHCSGIQRLVGGHRNIWSHLPTAFKIALCRLNIGVYWGKTCFESVKRYSLFEWSSNSWKKCTFSSMHHAVFWTPVVTRQVRPKQALSQRQPAFIESYFIKQRAFTQYCPPVCYCDTRFYWVCFTPNGELDLLGLKKRNFLLSVSKKNTTHRLPECLQM